MTSIFMVIVIIILMGRLIECSPIGVGITILCSLFFSPCLDFVVYKIGYIMFLIPIDLLLYLTNIQI